MIRYPQVQRSLHCQQLSLASGIYYSSEKAALFFLFFDFLVDTGK
jgi:hypothetical protein